MKKFCTGIFFALTIFIFTACGNSEIVGQDFSATLKNSFQTVEQIKFDLSNAAENLSMNSQENTVENLKQVLDSSKEKISAENKNLTDAEIPEKFADSNKKILECLKIEYNLLDRLKENILTANEYEAADNFAKSKELFTNLKEQSALLNVDGNNFEEVFELSTVCQKIENYLNSKKQLRFDRDNAEQAKKDAAAARAKIEQNNSIEREIGVYPATGLRAYLLTNTIMRFSDGFSCTVVCYPSGKPYRINYTFTQRFNGVYFTNSDGYGEYIDSFETPVEYNVWQYVW